MTKVLIPYDPAEAISVHMLLRRRSITRGEAEATQRLDDMDELHFGDVISE
jgi:hypothetical protein